jgi:hypothetical protein
VLWIETRGIGNAGDELVAKPPKLTTLLLEAVNAHHRGVPVGLVPEAYTAFNTSMGSLAVPPACLRTYCPKVAREDSVDAARHRILTSMTLARELNAETKQFSERLARVISTLPRLGFWESAVDPELQRASTVLEKRRVTVPIVPAHVFDAAASVGATARCSPSTRTWPTPVCGHRS